MEDGIKTFPFPTKLNDKIKMIELEFGIKGYAVVWKLYQAIHSVGYYLKWDIDAQLLFINDYRLSEVGRSCVSEIVASCLRRGVFESSLYEKYGILTSEEIQETFLTAKARSKKVIVNKDYALPIVYTFIENARKNKKNVNIFWKNADISEQRKEKEKKEKEIKEDDSVRDIKALLENVVFDCKPIHTREEYAKAKDALNKSKWARENLTHLSKIHHVWDKLVSGYYQDRKDSTINDHSFARQQFVSRTLSPEELEAMFDDLNSEEI